MPLVLELERKLELLRTFRSMSKKAFAAEFDLAWNTIRDWRYQSKNADAHADNLPEKHLPTFRRLIAEALPQASPSEIDALIFGSAAEFELALRGNNAPSIHDVIEAEARRGTARLKLADRIGLVEHDGDQALPTVKLHQRFMIEYRTSKPGYALLVQHAQQQWAAVRFASGKASEKRLGGSVLVPGQTGSNSVHIRETASLGKHRFLLFVSPQPYPRGILTPAAAGAALEWPMLCDLARHYLNQPAALRELHLYEVEVVASPG